MNTPNTLDALLRELAAVAPGPVIATVSLDIDRHDEHHRERLRSFVQSRSRDAAALARADSDDRIDDTLQEVRRRVEAIAENDVAPGARGLYLVASAPRGMWRELYLPTPIRPGVHLDRRPWLTPLSQWIQRNGDALLAEVDATGARILHDLAGEMLVAGGVEQEAPKRHAQGGWSQSNFQRHVRELIVAVWRGAAQTLQTASDARPSAPVVLVGQPANTAAFERCLSDRVRRRVVGRVSLDSHGDWLARARAVIDEARRRDDQFHCREVQERSGAGATLGLRPTLEALARGRAHTVLLDTQAQLDGFSCPQCGTLWYAGSSGCPFCGGAMERCDLTEAVVRRAFEGNYSIRWTHAGLLDRVRGIASTLRGTRPAHALRRRRTVSVDLG